MRLKVTLSLILLCFVGCSEPADPNTPAYWIDQLEEKPTREQALKELGKMGDPSSAEAVLVWLKKEGPWQPTAAYTLGQLGAKSSVNELIAQIDYAVGSGRDRKSQIKNRTNMNIARALGMLKAKEGTQPLMNLLATAAPAAKEQIIRALGKIQDPAATDSLVQTALYDAEPFLRKTAIQALGDLGDPKAADALIEMLYVEVPGISFYNEARFSLVQLGPSIAPKLLTTLKRENAKVEKIRLPSGGTIAEGAIEAKAGVVLGLLRVTEAESAILGVLNGLYKKFQNRTREPIFASIPGAIIELCFALGNMGTGNAVKTLEKLAADTDFNIRQAAVEALVEAGAKGSATKLLDYAKSGEGNAQKVAMVGATQLGEAQNLSALEALAAKNKTLEAAIGKEKVRLVAAQECGAKAECWQTKLGDANYRVREKAALELGWLNANNALADLVKSVGDEQAAVRIAAIQSLHRLKQGDVKKLKEIYKASKSKIEFNRANHALKRLIAQLENAA
ncbi:MAG: hypothetical protein CMH60_01780 [Myxococcales bacterium]|nr:hypothetical protein [Myxococcales bacterium]